jgi:DNA-binding CsgD family transcriptional regulator
MLLYESEFLSINLENNNDRFVEFWKQSPDSIETLKKELLVFTNLYEKYRPSQSLWLQKNFSLDLDNETHHWIEENINQPCVSFGNKKVAFVVGEDVLAHLSVISSFEETNSVITHAHFASRKEAEDWLDEIPKAVDVPSNTEIMYEGVDGEGNCIIKIKRPAGDITNTIKSFKNLIEENAFIKENINKYSLLTNREKEILVVYAQGLKHQEIADKLYISILTLRTHWKNIKSKLGIKSVADVIKYVTAFNMK